VAAVEAGESEYGGFERLRENYAFSQFATIENISSSIRIFEFYLDSVDAREWIKKNL